MRALFTMKLTGVTGGDFDRCANEALRIACYIGINVAYDFNGIECFVRPGDDITLLYPYYECCLRISDDYHKRAYCNKIP